MLGFGVLGEAPSEEGSLVLITWLCKFGWVGKSVIGFSDCAYTQAPKHKRQIHDQDRAPDL